jgi:CBS domain containing-hemolysin-like protein
VSLLLLILLYALIALAYAALTNSRQSELREQTEAGEDTPPRLHITYQLCQMLIGFAIAVLAVSSFGQVLATAISRSINDLGMAELLADIVVLLPTALLTLVLGSLVPEAVGSRRADQIAPWAVGPMRLLVLFFSPLVTGMISLSRALASAFGSSGMVNVYTEEEIMTLLDAGEKEGTIENEEKEMIYSVLQFGDKLAREVMIPRIDVVALDIDTPLDEALTTFLESGHSRIPVYEDSIDHIKGLLYAKDLLNVLKSPDGRKPIKDLMRNAFFVPESKQADLLLKELQTSKIHMAVVVDEYGGTAGLVTIEDLLEEIVGDIQDEYDLHEESEFVQNSPDEYTVDASINLSDLNDLLEVELPNDDSDTLGGFIFTQLGRVPEVGERLEYDNLLMRVESLDGRRIRKVHITRKPRPAEGDSPASGGVLNPQPHPVTE